MKILVFLLYIALVTSMYRAIRQSDRVVALKCAKTYDKKKRAATVRVAERQMVYLILQIVGLVAAILTIIYLYNGCL